MSIDKAHSELVTSLDSIRKLRQNKNNKHF